MARRSALTTGEAAAHCQVSAETVANWVRRGQLEAYRTPGGHRRIRVDDFRQFLAAHGMPPLAAPARRQRQLPRILVVDDDPAVLALVVAFLGQTGEHRVATAADGFEAGIQIGRLRPDLVVLDLMMPQLDGFSVCRRLKDSVETRPTAVLVLTGYGDPATIQRALACGADECMTKPFSGSRLRQRVDYLLSRVHPAAAPELAHQAG
ncbi:MAG: response regulator [Gemmatimonadota bacterium]